MQNPFRQAAYPGWSEVHEERLRSIQYDLLTRQVPVLYVVLAVAMVIAAMAFADTAPSWLTTWFVLPMLCVIAFRFATWLRLGRINAGVQDRVRHLDRTTRVATALTAGFTAWGIALLQFGQGLQPAVAIAFILITSFGCAFCLACLPKAAFRILTLSGVPFSVALALNGDASLLAAAGIFMLVSALMVRMVRQYEHDLMRLVGRQIEVEVQHGEVREAYELAHKCAYMDALTGLGNRRSLLDELGNSIAEAEPGTVAVIMVDLDGFKTINDVHGHTGGDAMLRQVATRLCLAVKDRGAAFRLGGDEFALVVGGIGGEAEAADLARDVCIFLEDTYDISGSTGLIKISCGLAVADDPSVTPQLLLDRADKALVEAKRTGASRPLPFTADLEDLARRRSQVEQALRGALINDELEVKFQPIVDLADRRIIGLEALARWEDERLGPVEPGEFIAVAEQSGLMDQLTFALLRKAIRHAVHWPSDYYLSFNLSAVDVMRATTPLRLLGIVAELGIDPRRIVLEITETALLHDIAQASRTLDQLKGAGIRVALDDFGTGHASFSNLHDLSLDHVKIDRMFTANIVASRKSQIIVRAILGMCKELSLPVIAEGIETEEQHSALRALGCDSGQGFHYGHALPPQEVLELIGGDGGAAAGRKAVQTG